MSNKLFATSAHAARLTAALAFLLTACGGNDGAAGPAGPPGTTGANGVPVTDTAQSLVVTIDSITTSATPQVVNFTVKNEDGTRYVGLTASQIRFTVAKLVPGTNGSPNAWESYITKKETPPTPGAAPNDWPSTTPALQADYDRNGTFVSNGDGTYSYAFNTNLTNATCALTPCPVDVSWQPTYTHRLGVQISGTGVPVTNLTYDWRPSDGATTGLTENDIVATASCNECHGKLAVHGGGRVETKYCVTCHNPGTTDANSGNTVDFKVFIHKLHRGDELPSVVGGAPYVIWGFNNSKVDFSDVAFPQDIRNCTKCHDAADAATPQADLWETKPNRAACGSCHDNVDFATGQGHTANNVPEADDSQCTVCHSSTGFPGSVASTHAIPAKVIGAHYKFTLVSAAFNGGYPQVTYKVTDPTNGDAAYNLLDATDLRWACVTGTTNTNCGSGASRLGIDISWSTPEISNTCDPADFNTALCQTGATSAPASAIALNGLGASSGNNGAITSNFATDGTFTVTSLRHLPANVGTMVVALEGHPAGDYDGDGKYTDRVPVKSVIKNVAVNDATAVARRAVVDIAKCDKCHDQLSLHGSNRTDEPQICVLCHNPNNTDIAQRKQNTGNASNIWPPPDGLVEQSIDFKYMIHAIHGAEKRTKPYIVYGNSQSTNDFSHVLYPGILNNCATCHVNTSTAQTFQVPLKAEVEPTTFSSSTIRWDPSDDLKTTVTASVCSSCHDTDTAETHMQQNGAQFSVVGPNGSAETCEVCHGSGRIADVSVVHSVQ